MHPNRTIDPSTVKDPKLRAALEKVQQDLKEGKPYKRPVFNPFLYASSRDQVSVVNLSGRHAFKSDLKLPLLSTAPKDDTVDIEILTSVLVATSFVSSIPHGLKVQLDIVEPTDIERFRLPQPVNEALDKRIIDHTLASLALYEEIKQATNDTYSMLSVLPLSLSVRLRVVGTVNEWNTLVQPTTDQPKTFLSLELMSIVEQVKTFLAQQDKEA